MFRRSPLAATLLVLLATDFPAGAILIRPDRKDEDYRALAERHPASCLIGLPDGEGTLIAPRWILTAAHIAEAVRTAPSRPRPEFLGVAYEIEEIFVHPKWTKRGPHDIGLLKLKTPVSGVTPVPIYRGSDEVGRVATIVGHGYTGTLAAGPKPKSEWDRSKRAATNKIVIAREAFIGFLVDPPETATDLEGTGGPGDSGGPAFIEEDGRIFVAGVSSATDDSNSNGIVGDFGDREIFTRVSSFAEWIDETTK